MDGSTRIGQRVLRVDFCADRHSTTRIESAYLRLQRLAEANSGQTASVQDAEVSLPAAGALVTEDQG